MAPGDLLGDRFEIEQAIRSGGVGEVFRALDRVSNQPVAVKLISATRDDQTQRFLREIELLAELSHPGIVRYVSHGATPSGRLFLAMEWLEGEDLEIRLERTSLARTEAVTRAARVAEALAAAHARGIVHRDLKPSNLFLPGGHIDQVKVLDFGIAHQQGRTQLTQTGTMIGTPGYMAPEQARTHGVVNARADVFALGCVLFHCLTGTPPFEGDNPTAVLGKILFGETPRVSVLWSEPADEALRHAIQPYSSRAEQLADGATIVVFESDHQVATDQAAQAARCALAIRAITHGRAMAIAMGRAESSSRLTPALPDAGVIDRASRLLSSRARVPGDPASRPARSGPPG